VVRVEEVEPVVVGDVAVRVAVPDRVDLYVRAVRVTPEHGPGAQHGRPAAVGPLDVVVVVAAGDVEQPVVAEGEAGHLVVVEPAEALGDGLADAPRVVRVGRPLGAGPADADLHALPPPPHGAAAGDVAPPVEVPD